MDGDGGWIEKRSNEANGETGEDKFFREAELHVLPPTLNQSRNSGTFVFSLTPVFDPVRL